MKSVNDLAISWKGMEHARNPGDQAAAKSVSWPPRDVAQREAMWEAMES